MKLEKVKIENEAGEVADITRADYIKHIVKTQEVQDYTTEESGTTPADKVVNHILKANEDGKDIDDGISGEYSDLISVIEADFKRTMESKVDKAAEAAAKKEAKEKEKADREEKEKAEKEDLVAQQGEFALSVTSGAEVASNEFKSELESLASALPNGVTVEHTGSGFGLAYEKGVSKEVVGQALGYLIQKGNNSAWIGNQINFWIGDTMSTTVDRGIYSTAKEASEHIAKVMSESMGRNIEARSLPQYQRMAERTPIEYRNPQADPTAYLAVSGMAIPKKGSDEKEDAFKARLSSFEVDRADLQKKLAAGEIVKRKDILPLVEAALIKNGLKVAPSTDPVISISEQLRVFFHASVGLEDLLSVQKEDVVIYKLGDDKITVTKEELEEMKASAYANLVNALYTDEKAGIKPADFFRGYVEKEVMVKVADDASGKPLKEPQTVKSFVMPRPFFEIAKEAAPTEAEPTEAAPTEAAVVDKKKGK